MSAPAVLLAAQVAAGAMAAYNVVKGLKSGNMMQAVMGGVSAFASFGALGAATGAMNAASAGATGVANQAASLTGMLGQGAATTAGTAAGAAGSVGGAFNAAQGGLMSADALTNAASGTLADVGSTVASGAGEALGSAAGAAMNAAPGASAAFDLTAGAADMMPNLVEAGAAGLNTGGMDNIVQQANAPEPSFFDKVTGYLGENPEMMAKGMEMGGKMLSGYAQGAREEEMYERRMKELEEARSRRGAAAGNVGWMAGGR